MIFVVFVVLTIATSNAEDGQNEITSNAIVERSPSTDKAIEPREFIDKTVVRPVPGSPMNLRRSRYLRQALRPRRRPPFEPRNMRRPGNNFPNLYGPRSRFKPNAPFRPGPPKSRFRYRDNWRHKWPEYHHPPPMYLDEEEMEQDPPYEEYDDGEEYKDDLWYSPKKYRDMYDDAVPTSSKYNEKRSPSRYLASYDYSRPKVRANYDPFESIPMKDAAEWQDRNRYSKNYRNILDILTNGKKYDEEEPIEVPMHRFKLANWNRFKQLEDDEYDFSSSANGPTKSRRMKTEKAVMRRPQVADDVNKYTKGEVTDVSKYFALMQASAGLSAKEQQASQEAVYSAKYRGRDATDKGDDKSKFKIGEDVSSPDANILHDWKRAQKPNADFQSQFVATEEKSNGVVDAAAAVRNQNYKDDHLSPSELIAYMSVDPGESVVGKEERYLHTAYPFGEKLSDHDILKATFPRKISPIIDQDLEITFDDRIGDWKH